eukprot:COSAG02_NODE_8874_length_2410_cov_2.165082_3_plen_97_part_00
MPSRKKSRITSAGHREPRSRTAPAVTPAAVALRGQPCGPSQEQSTTSALETLPSVLLYPRHLTALPASGALSGRGRVPDAKPCCFANIVVVLSIQE